VKIQLVQDRMSSRVVAKTLVNVCIRQSILTSCALDANCESETSQKIVCNDHVTSLQPDWNSWACFECRR